MWTIWSEREFCSPAGKGNPDRPYRSVVVVELSYPGVNRVVWCVLIFYLFCNFVTMFRIPNSSNSSVFIQFIERQLTVNIHPLHQSDFGKMNSGVFICWPVPCQVAAMTLKFAGISQTECIESSLIRCIVCEDKAAPDRKHSDIALWSVFVWRACFSFVVYGEWIDIWITYTYIYINIIYIYMCIYSTVYFYMHDIWRSC